MESKKITLALHPGLYALIKKRADARFMGIQQVIYDALQKEFLSLPASASASASTAAATAAATPKSNAGRPKKSDDPYLDLFSTPRRKR